MSASTPEIERLLGRLEGLVEGGQNTTAAKLDGLRAAIEAVGEKLERLASDHRSLDARVGEIEKKLAGWGGAGRAIWIAATALAGVIVLGVKMLFGAG